MPGSARPAAYGTLTDVAADEQEALASQLRVEGVKLSFFSIFSYATWPETALIAICTVCAIVAGGLVPFTPVIRTASSIDCKVYKLTVYFDYIAYQFADYPRLCQG